MRVFIFEHICGGGLARIDLRQTLARKGGAMLSALVEDFVRAGFEVVTSLDSRVALPLAGASVEPVEPGSDCTAIFDRIASSADAALVVAPEFDGLLESWARRLERLKVRSLGCSPAGIALCGDKLELSRHLLRGGVATPMTLAGLPATTSSLTDRASAGFPLVAKPRYGAGCEDTFVCRTAADLAALPRREDWIVQPFVPGVAASCAFIVHGASIRPLRAGEQFIPGAGAGKLAYGGGRMPLEPELEARAMELGRKALQAVPGLNGFVGVDLVLAEEGEGADAADFVIEINPRPTVAFVGLRTLCRTNLAAAILDPAAPLEWERAAGRAIRFDASGKMAWEEDGR